MEVNRCFPAEFDAALAQIIASGEIMVRDDDYLRQMLLEFEAADMWMFPGPSVMLQPNADDRKRSYHMMLMIDGGLITKVDVGSSYYRMTNAAHDLLAMTRKSESWEAVKSVSARIGGASAGVLVKIAEALAMQKLREMGLPL